MRFRKGTQPIEALAPDGADDSFANRVGLWTSRWRFQHGDAEVRDGFVQMRGKDTIAIVKQILISVFQSNRLAQLLQDPSRCRMAGDVAMNQAAAAVLNHHEHV